MTVSVVPYRENMVVSAKDLNAHETGTANFVKSLNDLIKEMSGVFVERSSVIRAMVTAAVAGEHCFILGKPGTAKSALARSLAGASNLSYFEILMTKFTNPEEIFGPIKLSALQQDRFDRAMTGYLPTSQIIFLDEVWKSSSAILNSLLTVLNERKFHNDGKAIDIPLMQCISASNELPEGPELEALYDRFLVRCVVDYIDDDELFIGMLKATTVQISSKINLVQAQIDAEKVKVSDATYKKIGSLRKACRKESITVSDRRWKQCLSLLRAVAYIDGRTSTEPEDIEILEHVLWHNPDERAQVSKVIQASVSPNAAQAVKELDAARSRFASLPTQIPTASADRSKLLPDLASANQDLKEIADRLAKLPDGKKVQDARKEVAEIRSKVAKIAAELMGL